MPKLTRNIGIALSPKTRHVTMGKISKFEYFRVPPRWLFVKVTDEDGNVGWGEASLEGHTQAVEGCLDAWFERYSGFEAEYANSEIRCRYSLAELSVPSVI